MISSQVSLGKEIWMCVISVTLLSVTAGTNKVCQIELSSCYNNAQYVLKKLKLYGLYFLTFRKGKKTKKTNGVESNGAFLCVNLPTLFDN